MALLLVVTDLEGKYSRPLNNTGVNPHITYSPPSVSVVPRIHGFNQPCTIFSYLLLKRCTYKWTSAVQTHVVQESAVLLLPFFLNFFFIFFISWRLITLQYCSGFCHTLTWISHGFTCIPHPDSPSHLPLQPIPLGLPSAPGSSTCLMHPTWAGDSCTSFMCMRSCSFQYNILCCYL